MQSSQREPDTPSAWVCRFAPLLARGSRVLDLACGSGRHARHLAGLGLQVEAVDRNAQALLELAGTAGVNTRTADLERDPWPYAGTRFNAIVVTNYLHRPLFPTLLAGLAAGGMLIYETFAAGNEKYGRPANPDFLLNSGELLEVVRGRLRVIAFEDCYVDVPRPAVVQRICAVDMNSAA